MEIKYVSNLYVSDQPPLGEVPDPPYQKPFAERIGTTRDVRVYFNPSVTGGVATSYLVTSYKLPYLILDTPTGTGVSSPITVTGLPDFGVYKFKVQGVNASGAGPVSRPTNSIGYGTDQGQDDQHSGNNKGAGSRDDHKYYWPPEV